MYERTVRKHNYIILFIYFISFQLHFQFMESFISKDPKILK